MTLPMADPPATQQRSAGFRQKHVRQLMKTEMCKFFPQGRCGKGSRCTFAHSITEIRQKPDLEKTSMCSQFLQTGNCDRPNCAFAHDERELRTTVGFFKTKLCRFASSGRCRHGEQCRFAHDISELSPEGLRALQEEEAALAAKYELNGREHAPSSNACGSVDTPRGGTSASGTGGSHQSGTSADSDQSTRADLCASIPTPEGSGDSGQESEKQPPQFGGPGWRGGGASEGERPARRSGNNLRGRHCTTLMVSNVPSFLTQGALVSLLEDLTVCMRGAFDFFYCPWNPQEDRNLGYAMINFFSRSTAAEFERQWSGETLLPQRNHGAKRLHIVPAALQGRAANIRHFSGFALAQQADPRFRPLVRAGPNEALRPMALSEELGRNAQRIAPEPMDDESQHFSQAQAFPNQARECAPARLPPYMYAHHRADDGGCLSRLQPGQQAQVFPNQVRDGDLARLPPYMYAHHRAGDGGWAGSSQDEGPSFSRQQPWAMIMPQGIGGWEGAGAVPLFNGLPSQPHHMADDFSQ